MLEDSPAGTVPVGNLSATDPDSGDTLPLFHPYGPTRGGRFQIARPNQLQVAAGQRTWITRRCSLPSHNVSAVQETRGPRRPDIFQELRSASAKRFLFPDRHHLERHDGAGEFSRRNPRGQPCRPSIQKSATRTHAFTLTDNAGGRFQISVNQLQVAPAGPNFEATAAFNVTIRATDRGGLTLDKTFAISLSNVNEAPASLALSSALGSRKLSGGDVIGLLSATDVDAGDTQTFSLTDNAGGRFQSRRHSTCQVATGANGTSGWPRATTSRSGVTDSGKFDRGPEGFSISVSGVNEAPTAIALSAAPIPENSAAEP